MARRVTFRTVQCYHCAHRFEVSSSAESSSCPGCNKPVMVGDMTVKTLKPVQKVQTCGKIIVAKRGRIIADLIVAVEGIEVEGVIDAKKVISGGPVTLAKKAEWRGDLMAPSLQIADGAKVRRSYFEIPVDHLGVSDIVGRDPP